MQFDKNFIELEITHETIESVKVFLIVDEDEKIWVDAKGLPKDAFFCAFCDAVPYLKVMVGEEKKTERTFLPMDWLISETGWGGPKELIEVLKKRNELTIRDMPNLRKKYKDVFEKSENKT